MKRFLYFAWAAGLGFWLLFLALSLPLLAAPTRDEPTAVSHPPNPTNPTNPPTRAIIYLHEQVNLERFTAITDETERHIALIEQLQTTAVTTQRPLHEKLTLLQASGQIESFRPLWIVNAIAVSGPAEVVAKLAEEPGVARVAPDEAHPLINQPQIREGVAMDWATAVSSPSNRTSNRTTWGVERIQAPYVWHGLGITGEGVTVAIMDSGVDWLHPDLNPNYRGNLPGGVSHLGNWYNAPDPTITEPFDAMGHGTHVAGTAVGQNGIGVAPGASWIAVNIANANGLIYDSDIHASFQWLLAPAGDPALAPDIINGSWGAPGWLTTYNADIQALHLAGILTVFAAGNSGPATGSILTPGGLPGVLTVGASDPYENVTWFSSRGPSPLTNETKPALVAPGAQVLSSLPGGQYNTYNGTSMAAPHASGAAALLLSGNPTLSRQAVMAALTTTAVSLAQPIPNLDSGWGRLEIYTAVGSQPTVGAGLLQGTVRHNGLPQPGVVVSVTTPGGELGFVTDENGRYQARLKPGVYQLQTAPFGFVAAQIANLQVAAGQTTEQEIALTRLPSGVLNVSVREASSQSPVSARIKIFGTPISQPGNAQGNASFLLPAGTYQLQIGKAGYRLSTVTVVVPVNGMQGIAVDLAVSERILLVDSGLWYYQSYAGYYQRALTNLGYAFDDWPIYAPFDYLPDAEDLAAYDVVLWSSPFDSPGYIWGGEAVSRYLEGGGKLLISGQNAGYYDGAVFYEPWWYNQLQANYLNKTAVPPTITGAANSLFDGLAFSLNGPDSAQNQVSVDQARPLGAAITSESFYHEDGRAVGLVADQCRPYHLSYLGFGLEGVSGAVNREAILRRTLAYFQTPETETGARWLPGAIDDFAVPGREMVYALRLQNRSEVLTDTFSLSLTGAPWSATISPAQVTIPSCKTAVVTITLSVPANLPLDEAHEWGITAVSQANPTTQTQLPVRHKTPGRILLVDDDRWYDQEAFYQSALEQAGFRYDYWNIGWTGPGRGSPPSDLLNAYEYIIWFTGYDWFQPITPAENAALTAYLAQGGRLFLSSQDFLYYHWRTPLARDYLGVVAYQESITPTQVYAGHPALPPETAGPLPLVYPPFRNHSDGLIPALGVEPFLWHDQGMLAGLAANGAKTRPVGMERPFRAIFWGIPFEKTLVAHHPAMMESIVGWLSDLGDSSFVVDQPVGAMGETRRYTITLRNGHDAPNQTSLTNTLPAALDFVAFADDGGATYDPAAKQLRWSGLLPGGGEQTISYLAAPQADLPPGSQVINELEIAYERHEMRFGQTAVLWLETPDLRPSQLAARVQTGEQTQLFTYTLTLANEGLVAAGVVTAVLRLPEPLFPLSHTLQASNGAAALAGRSVTWHTSLLPAQSVSLTIALTRPISVNGPDWLSAAAYIEDGFSPSLIRGQFSHAPPYRHYLPIIAHR
jgi:uncharacterized repeat protein (TIGR01451 family)